MIEKFSDIWASSGDTGTEPSSTKQSVGFVRREKPIRQLFNWLLNGLQTKINLLIDDGSRSYDLSSDANENLTKQFYGDEGWALFDSAPNKMAVTGSTPSLRDVRSYVDSSGNSIVLALDRSGEQIHKINPRTKATSASGDLTTNLMTSIGSWQIQSFLTDGIYAYVLFYDNGAGNARRIQSYLLSNWTENPSWPSTGRMVTSSGSETPNNCMCWATGSIIAIACAWITCNSASSNCVFTLNASDGSSHGAGSGDCITGGSYNPTGSICSDGSYIYFSVSGPNQYVCSADIAALTSGSGGTDFPLIDSYQLSLCSVGDGFVAVPNDTAPGTGGNIVRFGDSSNAFLDEIVAGEDYLGRPNERVIFGGVTDVIFDGINIWILTTIEKIGASTQAALLRIDAGKLSKEQRASVSGTQYVRTLFDICDGAQMLSDDIYYNMTFDGRDILLSCNDNSAPIRRFPLASRR